MRIKTILLLVVCFGCKKETIENAFKESLTVEGIVEHNKPVKVYLTSNLPFKDSINTIELLKAEEGRAKITVSDGNDTEILLLDRDNSRYPSIFYRSLRIKGALDKKYNLNIILNKTEYSSITTIPNQPMIQSVKVVEEKQGDKVIALRIKNTSYFAYFKLFIKLKNDKKYLRANPFIFNNELFDVNEDLQFFIKGDMDKIIENFEVGDVYDLKLVGITKDQFLFYKSVFGDETSLGGSTTFSENIESNILGGNDVLGYWSGENSIDFKIRIE